MDAQNPPNPRVFARRRRALSERGLPEYAVRAIEEFILPRAGPSLRRPVLVADLTNVCVRTAHFF